MAEERDETPNTYTVCALGQERHEADETYCMKHQCGTYKMQTHQKEPGHPMQGPVTERRTF